MGKVICIFPEDRTTDFLMPIYEQIEKIIDFIGYRFDTNDQYKKQFLYSELNTMNDISMLLFLGHGASNMLYGSVGENGDKQELFNKNNISHLSKVNFVGVACRSKEFAHNSFKNYIGFGDITSDFSEIIAERNYGDPNYLDWATEIDVDNFQKLFVESIKNAILLSKCSDISLLYKMMKLCFNKQIAELVRQKNIPNYHHLADMMFNILSEMTICLS